MTRWRGHIVRRSNRNVIKKIGQTGIGGKVGNQKKSWEQKVRKDLKRFRRKCGQGQTRIKPTTSPNSGKGMENQNNLSFRL